jgi:hypothetical protein
VFKVHSNVNRDAYIHVLLALLQRQSPREDLEVDVLGITFETVGKGLERKYFLAGSLSDHKGRFDE